MMIWLMIHLAPAILVAGNGVGMWVLVTINFFKVLTATSMRSMAMHSMAMHSMLKPSTF